jgi:Fe2+ or Zn2+ uptake regulation protein
LDQFQRELEERFRFEVVDHCLEFYGYCLSCKRRKKG